MALNTAVTDVAAVIAKDLQEGRGTRTTVGGGSTAWSWTSGLPNVLANFVSSTTSEGLNVPLTIVEPSGTPAAKVAAGAAKPNAVTVTPKTVTVSKHAGLAEFSLESVLDSSGLLPAINGVLSSGALMSYETEAMAVLAAGKGDTETASTWLAAILAAQASVISAGGSPGVLVLSAADYAAVVGELAGQAGLVSDPASPVGALYGSLLHVSAKAPAGTAYIVDPAAVLAVQHVSSPLVIVDPYSKSSTNEIRLVADLLATTVVVSGAGVVAATKGAMATASTAPKPASTTKK